MLGGMLGTVTGSFAGGVASSDPAHGVVRATDFAVTQNGTPNMSVNVAAGGAFIRGTQNANQGAYHVWNDGTVNLSISAADATNGRRDLVIAQVRDAFYSGATNDARITVVTGTPAASPADPSLASFPNALVLARITIAAGDTAINTADITDLRPVANQSGKLPVFTTQALATTAIPSPYDGQGYYLNSGTATEGPLYWHGSAYRLPWSMPWGFIGRGERTSDVIVNTGTFDVTGCTTTFTALTNRLYRITARTIMDNNHGSAQGIDARILIGATTIQLIPDFLNANPTAGDARPMALDWVGTIASGSVTAKLQGTFSAGGSNNFRCGPTQPSYILVEDIGPAGAPA